MKHETRYSQNGATGDCDLPLWRLRRQQSSRRKGREAVKEVVTQPFNAFDSAKDSLKQSDDKQKAALEEANKEIK